MDKEVISPREKSEKEQQNVRIDVLKMCWTYLQMNFHKFTTTNQIKIALTLASKDIPQTINGLGDTKIIIVKDKEGNAKVRDNSRAIPVQVSE